MSILTQEIVDYLNQSGDSGLGAWLENNPVIGNFVTCPYICVRPTAIPRARRILVFETARGRFVEIQYRDGSQRYIVDVASMSVTVEFIEQLIHTVEAAAGHCHVERSYLILYVPLGYHLRITREPAAPLRLQHDVYEDIGLDSD